MVVTLACGLQELEDGLGGINLSVCNGEVNRSFDIIALSLSLFFYYYHYDDDNDLYQSLVFHFNIVAF